MSHPVTNNHYRGSHETLGREGRRTHHRRPLAPPEVAGGDDRDVAPDTGSGA